MARTPKGPKAAAPVEAAGVTADPKDSDDDDLFPETKESEEEDEREDPPYVSPLSEEARTDAAVQARTGQVTVTGPPVFSQLWWQQSTPEDRERLAMQRLLKKLGFTDEAAKYVTEVDLVNSASILKDLNYDQCEQIVKNTRKQDSGRLKATLSVADRALRNFQLTVTVAKHYARTARDLTPDNIEDAIPMFSAYKAQKEIEDQQRKEKPELPTGLTLDNTPKAGRVFEAVVEHFGRYRGINGAPLSYVVRENVYPPDGPDPMYNAPYGSRYVSFDAEMVRRSPIALTLQSGENGPFHPSFLADMTKVWEILHDLFSTQAIWVHVKGKKFATSRNGRACFQELHRHILGQGNAHSLGLAIMDKLNATKYDGQTKNWNFDKYVAAHVDLHNQAEHLAPYGFTLVTGHVKVNAFTRNISEKAGFGPVAMSILSDASLQGDFDRVKQLYVDYYRRHLLHATGVMGGSGPRSVSSVKTGGERENKKRKSDEPFRAKVPTQAQMDGCKVKLRTYSKDEYEKLDWIAKYKLRKMRQDAKNAENGAARGATSTVSSVTFGESTGEGGGSNTVVTTGSSGSNSGNPALVRPNVADRH